MLPTADSVSRPDTRTLALLAVRRAFGVAIVLYAFYLGLFMLGQYPFLRPTAVLTILGVVLLGTVFGVGFSTMSPLPAGRGLPRVIRTVLLSIPALGIGAIIQVLLEGARADMAIFAIFALAAWLGSTFIREDDTAAANEEESSVAGLFT